LCLISKETSVRYFFGGRIVFISYSKEDTVIFALLFALFELGSEVNQFIEIEVEKDEREIRRLKGEQQKARARKS